jgi:hypothetical protein
MPKYKFPKVTTRLGLERLKKDVPKMTAKQRAAYKKSVEIQRKAERERDAVERDDYRTGRNHLKKASKRASENKKAKTSSEKEKLAQKRKPALTRLKEARAKMTDKERAAHNKRYENFLSTKKKYKTGGGTTYTME